MRFPRVQRSRHTQLLHCNFGAHTSYIFASDHAAARPRTDIEPQTTPTSPHTRRHSEDTPTLLLRAQLFEKSSSARLHRNLIFASGTLAALCVCASSLISNQPTTFVNETGKPGCGAEYLPSDLLGVLSRAKGNQRFCIDDFSVSYELGGLNYIAR